MEKKYEDILKAWDEYLASDAADEWFKAEQIKEDRQKLRHEKADFYFKSLTNEQFDLLMKRLIDEHTEKLKDLWYKKCIMPMPTNKMEFLFDHVFMYSNDAKNYGDYPELFAKYETGFSDDIAEFRGYVFHLFFGQGVGHKIHKDGEEIFGGW